MLRNTPNLRLNQEKPRGAQLRSWHYQTLRVQKKWHENKTSTDENSYLLSDPNQIKV